MVRDVFLKGSGQVRFSALAHHFGVVGGLLELIVAAGFSLARAGFLLCDSGVALDFSDARATQGHQVAFFVAHVFDHKAVDTETHVGQVTGGYFLHALGEDVALAVDLLDGQRADDGAQVTSQRFVGDFSNFVARFGEEALGCCANRYIVAGNLDLRDAFQRDGHTLFGVNIVGGHFDGHDLQDQLIDAFQHRPDERTSTCHDPVGFDFAGFRVAPLATRDDQHLIRADFTDASRVDGEHREHDEKHKE